VQAQAAALALHHFARQRQAQPGAGDGLRIAPPVIAAHQVRQLIGAHARAVVTDLQHHATAIAAGT